MPRAATFAFPPFTRTVKTLIGINVGVYFLMKLMGLAGQDAGLIYIFRTFALIPASVVTHVQIWQIVTYSFLHAGLFHVLFNMLTLWMFGSTMEQHWGQRQFLEFYFLGVVGGALTTIAIAYAGKGALGLFPNTPTVGASAGVYALLLAFGWYYGEQQVFMFPLPFSMKAKYMVGILILVALAGALGDSGGTANIAHLGGLLFAFLYLKFMPRRGFAFVFSEGFYGIRNSYHRWKRDQAKKKFQVYMRKHNNDPHEYFDQYGNFRPPDDDDKKDGKGGWVN